MNPRKTERGAAINRASVGCVLARTDPRPLLPPPYTEAGSRQKRRDQLRHDHPQNGDAVAVGGIGRGHVDHDPDSEGAGHSARWRAQTFRGHVVALRSGQAGEFHGGLLVGHRTRFKVEKHVPVDPAGLAPSGDHGMGHRGLLLRVATSRWLRQMQPPRTGRDLTGIRVLA